MLELMTTTSPVDRRTEGRAIAALVCGIAGWVAFPIAPSVLAIWLGVSARRRIDRDPTLSGEGMATAGVILGVSALVVAALAITAIVLLFATTVHSMPAG